jgi:hypothetical protein
VLQARPNPSLVRATPPVGDNRTSDLGLDDPKAPRALPDRATELTANECGVRV